MVLLQSGLTRRRSAGNLNNPAPSRSLPAATIHMLSGDHAPNIDVAGQRAEPRSISGDYLHLPLPVPLQCKRNYTPVR